MVRPGRDRLAGTVEVDETYIGGIKPGKRGRGAAGKALVAVAVELLNLKGLGRCRLRVIPNAETPTLRSFLLDCVEPGSVVITDGFVSYPPASGKEYVHKPFPVAGSGVQAHVALPGVHRVASLVKRWLLGTHQATVEVDHLQAYLDEFAFRFNRRRAEFRGASLPPAPRTGGERRTRHVQVSRSESVPEEHEADATACNPPDAAGLARRDVAGSAVATPQPVRGTAPRWIPPNAKTIVTDGPDGHRPGRRPA
jgi:transposase-like protein